MFYIKATEGKEAGEYVDQNLCEYVISKEDAASFETADLALKELDVHADACEIIVEEN